MFLASMIFASCIRQQVAVVLKITKKKQSCSCRLDVCQKKCQKSPPWVSGKQSSPIKIHLLLKLQQHHLERLWLSHKVSSGIIITNNNNAEKW